MIPKRFISEGGSDGGAWEDLKAGAPTILGFAHICAAALSVADAPPAELSDEAKAILYTARQRGVVELKTVENAFDAVERFLAVYVECEEGRTTMFRDKRDPARTMKFLEGFRQLCAAGLMIHHLLREFSLTHRGFEVAAAIDPQQIQTAIAFGTTTDDHDGQDW